MKCPNCDGRGAVQIAPNVKGLKRCPVCGGSGKTTEYDGLRKFWCDYKCEYCNGTGEVEQTNEEWFCGLSTEEKAEWLCSKEYYCEFIDGCNYCPLFEADKHRCLDLSNKELWELWLKEKHE